MLLENKVQAGAGAAQQLSCSSRSRQIEETAAAAGGGGRRHRERGEAAAQESRNMNCEVTQLYMQLLRDHPQAGQRARALRSWRTHPQPDS